jgi:phenylalanyl-tRNA synthetase alpha subunit
LHCSLILNFEYNAMQNQMKREMLQKVNEAVANFRRVADQQMAEVQHGGIESRFKRLNIPVDYEKSHPRKHGHIVPTQENELKDNRVAIGKRRTHWQSLKIDHYKLALDGI